MQVLFKKYKYKLFLSLIVIFTAFFSKIVLYNYLDNKYLYDSNYLISFMNGNYISNSSVNFAAKFFDSINIFSFKNIYQWGIFLSVIFNIIILNYLLIKKDKYNLIEYIFIIASVCLLNIYNFNLGKDVIQFSIFLLIYLITINKKININLKVLIITIILMLEAIYFRVYYGIMGMLFIFVYAIYYVFKKIKKSNKQELILFFSMLITLFCGILFIKLISKDNYLAIINSRYNINVYRQNNIDAITIINDLFSLNDTYFNFILNYITNFLRINFPIEILFKGVKYIPFVIYQLFISFNIYKFNTRINEKNVLKFLIIISFLITSAIFEPDFGSFARHQTSLIFFYLDMILRKN